MAEGENGYKPPTLYRKFADRATRVGDWIIDTFGVIEMKPRPTSGEVVSSTTEASTHKVTTIPRPKDTGTVTSFTNIPEGTPAERATSKKRHPTTKNQTPTEKPFDWQDNETLPEGVTRLKPRDQNKL